MTPSAWIGVLLALGTFRLVRLAGWDDITIRLRRWATGLGDKEHHEWAHYIDQEHEAGRDPWDDPENDAPPISPRRYYFSKLVRCPWCVSVYLSAGVYVMWLAVPSVTLIVCVPLALSATSGLIAKNLDP